MQSWLGSIAGVLLRWGWCRDHIPPWLPGLPAPWPGPRVYQLCGQAALLVLWLRAWTGRWQRASSLWVRLPCAAPTPFLPDPAEKLKLNPATTTQLHTCHMLHTLLLELL